VTLKEGRLRRAPSLPVPLGSSGSTNSLGAFDRHGQRANRTGEVVNWILSKFVSDYYVEKAGR
jgi:hypothetical protein